MHTLPAHSLISTDLVVLNGVAFPIRHLSRSEDFITLTLIGTDADLLIHLKPSALVPVRPNR